MNQLGKSECQETNSSAKKFKTETKTSSIFLQIYKPSPEIKNNFLKNLCILYENRIFFMKILILKAIFKLVLMGNVFFFNLCSFFKCNKDIEIKGYNKFLNSLALLHQWKHTQF